MILGTGIFQFAKVVWERERYIKDNRKWQKNPFKFLILILFLAPTGTQGVLMSASVSEDSKSNQTLFVLLLEPKILRLVER